MPPFLSNFLIGLGVAYILLLSLLFVAQRRLMYHPTDERPVPAAYGLFRAEAFDIPSHDQLPLYSWWQPPRTDHGKVVLYFHGNAGSIAGRADRALHFTDQGHGILFPSYRYNAGAGGAPSEEALIADAIALYDWLMKQGFEGKQVVVYGESLGSGIAVALATQREVAALILEAPYSSIAEVAQSVYWYMPAKWLVHDKFDSTAIIGELTVPILIVHGGRDRVIPPRFARLLHEAAPDHTELVILPEAGHEDLYGHGMIKILGDFFNRQVLDSVPGASLQSEGAD